MRNATWLLVKDELFGFAKSKVMIVLWVILPAIAVLGYFVLPSGKATRDVMGNEMSAHIFMSIVVASIAGTVAALMVAVDIISEKNRKVYELFVIRPIKRDAILISKFAAVSICVTVACVVSVALGIGIDAIRGATMSGAELYEAFKSMVSMTVVIAMSAGVGLLFGVITKTILVAVILILYVGQNLVFVPMIPTYFGILPNAYWVFMAISAVLVLLLVLGSAAIFRRSEF